MDLQRNTEVGGIAFDDLAALLFWSLAGLDLSFWLLSKDLYVNIADVF
jgi:hypothetical protein